MKKRMRIIDIASAVLILLLVIVMLYSGLQILESTVLRTGADEQGFVSRTITRDGVSYYPRQDITVVMVLGIDQNGPVQATEGYINPGAADMAALLIFDDADKSCTVLQLNRDTMLEMPVLGVGGKNAGTYYGQLALSHTYGSGMADSCENTRRTISNFLYGIRIDYYLAMNMDAISILNDAVGGVTVNVTDDFSHVDPTITKGQMTLRGEQAIRFVRTRRDVGDQLNISRIDRQKEYIGSFLKKFRSRYHSDLEFAATTYDQVLPYIVTDCSLNTITSLMDRYGDYEIREVVSPAGENVMGEEYYEFYADEDALDELILRLFYAPKE